MWAARACGCLRVQGLRESGLELTPTEARLAFVHFDVDGSGSVSFEEFVQGMRDPLTPRRLALVHQAFKQIDKDGNGVLEPADVVGAYDASKHPEVIAGRMTPDQVLQEFLETFDVGGEVDGKVTKEEFVNYYTNVGANIDDDDYFELMIRNAWHISGGEGWCANTANRRVLVTHADGRQSVEEIKNDMGLKADDKAGMMARLKAQGVNAANISTFDGAGDDEKKGAAAFGEAKARGRKSAPGTGMLVSSAAAGVLPGTSTGVKAASKSAASHQALTEQKTRGAAPGPNLTVQALVTRMKAELTSRGARGIVGVQRKFRIIDDDGSGALSYGEFKKALGELNMALADPECRALFEHFDQDSSGAISFDEFIGSLRDPLTPRRVALVRLAFARIDKDGNGVLEPRDVVGAYDASKHPEVIAGRMTPEKVLQEFLETFDVGGEIDGKVTKEEFENYYTNIGASIDNDDYFELMIRNAWHISGGEGWCANTANRRVLVTHADGRQTVEEIKEDLGLKADDKGGMMARLKAQGLNAIDISTFDGGDDGVGGTPAPAKANKPKALAVHRREKANDPAAKAAIAGSKGGLRGSVADSLLHPTGGDKAAKGGEAPNAGVKGLLVLLKHQVGGRAWGGIDSSSPEDTIRSVA